jgi:predicted SnoaL-like aldol condensation-catalyzing enzyme
MKKLVKTIATIVCLVLGGQCLASDDCAIERTREGRNKIAALKYNQLLMGDRDYDAAEKYVGRYLQHDPMVDGDEFLPLKKMLTTHPWFKDRPEKEVEFHNVMADGNLVYFQLRNEIVERQDEKTLVQHVFRFDESGLADEHWVTVTTVNVSESKNAQPLY